MTTKDVFVCMMFHLLQGRRVAYKGPYDNWWRIRFWHLLAAKQIQMC